MAATPPAGDHFAEPVAPSALVEGATYFAVQFLDDRLLVPTIQPLVFIGWDRWGDEAVRTAYFQDAETHRDGVRFETTTPDQPADFVCAEENEISYIFDFQGMVASILATAARRSHMGQR